MLINVNPAEADSWHVNACIHVAAGNGQRRFPNELVGFQVRDTWGIVMSLSRTI